ncbi:MAG: YitT family protein [Erysipelotrichaceae bacterium]|nr:YitT family protein [Erysipelotrichaceae bacterium]
MKEKFKRILATIVGTVILALAVSMFIIPYNILTGGVAGVAIILHPLIPEVPKDVIASSVSIVMFVVGTICLGKEFSFKTALSAIIYSPLLIIFSRHLPTVEVEPLIACIYGGLLGGLGVGLVMRYGGSTGGMDVPPLLLKKYFNLDLSKGIFIVDALTVGMGLLEYNLGVVLFGLISVYVMNIGVQKALEVGGSRAKEIKFVSNRYQEIIDEIHTDLNRGSTIIDASGGYTKEERKMVMCVVKESQTQHVIDIVNKYDETAFIVVLDVTAVHGEGFTFAARM